MNEASFPVQDVDFTPGNFRTFIGSVKYYF